MIKYIFFLIYLCVFTQYSFGKTEMRDISHKIKPSMKLVDASHPRGGSMSSRVVFKKAQWGMFEDLPEEDLIYLRSISLPSRATYKEGIEPLYRDIRDRQENLSATEIAELYEQAVTYYHDQDRLFFKEQLSFLSKEGRKILSEKIRYYQKSRSKEIVDFVHLANREPKIAKNWIRDIMKEFFNPELWPKEFDQSIKVSPTHFPNSGAQLGASGSNEEENGNEN